MATDLAVALESARAGARQVLLGSARRVEVSYKADADPVTEVDHRSEQAIFEVLARHREHDPVVAEERGGRLPDSGRVWLVDPLDGTTNFTHGFPWMSVSVALWIDDVPQVAVVLDVITGDEYTAAAGEGGFVNGSRLGVSSVSNLRDGLVATGFPYDRRERMAICETRFQRVLGTAQGIRRMGSAALDLCMVAYGKLDAYWEEDLSPWDMAAGVLLVLEAGGTVTDRLGRPLTVSEQFVAASNGILHQQFLDTLGGDGS